MVAVILLNWNGMQDTSDCIDTLLESNYPDVCIYVVDNASANYEALLLAEKYPTVIVLAQKDNLGFCKGNNVGIQQALDDGAAYVMVLNNDTLVPADAIGKLVNDFAKKPDTGAISPVIIQHPDRTVVWFAKAAWDSSKAQFSLNDGNKTYEELKDQPIWESAFACGCCLLTSARVLKEVGLLDERYFAYYDEADWCSRLKKAGYGSYVTSGTIIYHVKHNSNYSRVTMYLLTRNRLLWMKENLSFKKRMKSFRYINQGFVWHFFNMLGLVKGEYGRDLSKAYLLGWLDFKLRRFGRWSDKRQQFFTKKTV